MANTIVRIHPNADFSQNNIGFIDPEPPIYVPGAPFANYRFGFSQARSLTNRAAGGSAPVTGGTLTLSTDKRKLRTENNSTISQGGTYSYPLSIAGVWKIEVAGVSQTLGLRPTSGGTTLAAGLCIGPSGGIAAIARGPSGNSSASLTKDGAVDRYEFLAATFDNTGADGSHQMKLYRPRTSGYAEALAVTLPSTITTPRILGSTDNYTNAIEGVRTVQWSGKVLTLAEVNDMYASWKTALAVSSISI